MTERERLIKELEEYEPYAACFSNLTVKGKLLLDILNFLRAGGDYNDRRTDTGIAEN